MFGLLRQYTRKRLRDLLWEKGVYVERLKGVKGVLTRDALYAAAQDKIPWLAEESKYVGQDKRPISQAQSASQLPPIAQLPFRQSYCPFLHPLPPPPTLNDPTTPTSIVGNELSCHEFSQIISASVAKVWLIAMMTTNKRSLHCFVRDVLEPPFLNRVVGILNQGKVRNP